MATTSVGNRLRCCAQQLLGDGDAAVAQRRRGREQSRVAGRGLDVLSVGRIRTLHVAERVEVIAECAPGVTHLGLELHRARSAATASPLRPASPSASPSS